MTPLVLVLYNNKVKQIRVDRLQNDSVGTGYTQ